MNGNGNRAQSDKSYNLSEILYSRVEWKGKKIGKLNDLVIRGNGAIPEVTQIVVIRPFGNPALLVPWEKVVSFEKDKVVIGIDDPKYFQAEPQEDALLLKDHILDKKILDLEDTEVEVVYDLQLISRNDRLYVTAVDSSRYGRWRRLGFRRTADLRQAADKMHENMIPWTIVQPLPPNMSSFKGEVKLKILKEKLAEMQPADVADILEELDHYQRLIVFDQLETEHASDTLEQIDPNVQREMVSNMQKDRVVELIDEMTSGQAADLLSALPRNEAETLMAKINPNLATKVRSIMEKVEEKAINYATSRFIRAPGDKTTDDIQNDYPKLAKGKMVVMYFYVVDENDKLLGVLDIKELLEAPDEALLQDVMITNVIALGPNSTLKEAAELFSRYDFRAIPVVDENEKILGVVPYRDVMRLTHHFVE
ncbi:MAG TPA: CBS domain-containing protein [Methanomassiliicoccales archaeon]|jgi:CBS domain-containing protein